MSTIILKAHYDGEHIVLDEPFDLPANASLAVMVLSASGEGSERSDWAALGVQSFARAYGEDEPEYALKDVKPKP